MFETVLQNLEPFAREFARHHKQIYLVGGAVRNLLLGKPAKDFDFTTDARPEEVQGYFRKVLPTGLQHGTVTVLFQGESYEVTTFRVDGAYTDGRRPDSVTFSPSLEEDLRRRDFTINAMALNLLDGTLADPHQGGDDLRAGVLRAIGDPGERFDEDALRLLRLFRFASQLGFSIDEKTLAAVPSRRPRLAAVSRERVREELLKAMAGVSPEKAWGPLEDLGFLQDLMAPLALRPLPTPALNLLGRLSPEVRWPFWLTLCTTPDLAVWSGVLKSLTLSNATVAAIVGPARALEVLGGRAETAKAVIERWGDWSRIDRGVEYLRALETVGFRKEEGLINEVLRVQKEGEPVFLSELALGGADLLAEGVTPGPQVGAVLKALQKEVWARPELNTAEGLRSRIRALP